MRIGSLAGTVALVVTVARGTDVAQQVLGRQPVTLTAAARLFGMVVIVGAALFIDVIRCDRARDRKGVW